MPHQSLGWRKVRLHVVQRQSFQVHASADIQSMDQKAERHLTSATPVLIFVCHERIPKLKAGVEPCYVCRRPMVSSSLFLQDGDKNEKA